MHFWNWKNWIRKQLNSEHCSNTDWFERFIKKKGLGINTSIVIEELGCSFCQQEGNQEMLY